MKTKIVREKNEVFGCAIRVLGSTEYFLAHCCQAAPKLFWKRHDAVEHQKELKTHGFRTRLVRVKMAFTYEVPKHV